MFACVLLQLLPKQIRKQKLSKYSIFFPLLRKLCILTMTSHGYYYCSILITLSSQCE